MAWIAILAVNAWFLLVTFPVLMPQFFVKIIGIQGIVDIITLWKFQIWLTDWLNGVLPCFQYYFSLIMATAHIFRYILGFTSSRLGLWTVFPKDIPMKKTQKIQWNLGPQGYKSHGSPNSHAGPLKVSWKSNFNPFPNNDTFWCPWETSLLKTLWEKEKLLVTSNFSFSHSVFYPYG